MSNSSTGQAWDLTPGMHIHLIGIGGAGLSAIAAVLLDKGFKVSGSDMQQSELLDELTARGAVVFSGHDPKQLAGAELVLLSSAIRENNPELIAARRAELPVFKRAEFLGMLMKGARGVAVAGTHGKSTTTGMIAQITIDAGLDPTVIVGGRLPLLSGNGRAGNGDYFVIEADEYDHMFLGLSPAVAVITNVEFDHPDMFPSPSHYHEAFERFVQRIDPDGLLIVSAEDPGAASLANKAQMKVRSFGVDRGDWRALEIRTNQHGGSDFVVQSGEKDMGIARLRVPGRYNVLNALAAIATTSYIGVEFGDIVQALGKFGGVGRRFQVIGEIGDVLVIDDYAHHPTEIKAILAAARQLYPGRRIWSVWQPHTFSRTRRLEREFVSSFEDADRVIVLDIFASREVNNSGYSAERLVEQFDRDGIHYLGAIEAAAQYISDRILPGDVVITMSAGDGYKVGKLVLDGLEKRTGFNADEKGTKHSADFFQPS